MTRTKIAGGRGKERGEFVQDHFFRVKVDQTRIQGCQVDSQESADPPSKGKRHPLYSFAWLGLLVEHE